MLIFCGFCNRNNRKTGNVSRKDVVRTQLFDTFHIDIEISICGFYISFFRQDC